MDLLRYGSPEPGHRFADSLNDPLRAIGWRHLHGAARVIAPWQQVVCSPAASSCEIAARLAREYRAPWRIVDGFAELDFGQWRGRELEELMANADADLQSFWQNPLECPPPGVELLAEFQHRVLGAWQQLLDDSAGQHTLLICHAGVQRVLVGMVLGKSLKELFALQTPYAGLSRISIIKESAGNRCSLVFQTGVR